MKDSLCDENSNAKKDVVRYRKNNYETKIHFKKKLESRLDRGDFSSYYPAYRWAECRLNSNNKCRARIVKKYRTPNIKRFYKMYSNRITRKTYGLKNGNYYKKLLDHQYYD